MLRTIRRYAAAASDLLHVCVVGSGPAGFYTADRLLKKYGDGVRVDILDRLPTPFGLVRSGVAPDHADTKNVVNQFSQLGRDPRTTYFGNVCVGRDVSVDELRRMYHAVVLAYGAESDRRLGIPGEDARGVFAAREFVWWYNGHPDATDLPVDLSGVDSVAVCGIGNVALDCARVLLRPAGDLATTDIAGHALEQLRTARVKQVHLFARRGPVQAACTPKELRELLTLPGLQVHAAPEQLAVSDADVAEMKAVRLRRRVHEIMSKAVASPPQSASHHLHLQFYRNPAEILAGPDGAVRAVRVERTRLQGGRSGEAPVAVGTGEYEEHEVQLVLKSIGYRSLPLEGVAFDARKGVIPNAGGRVLAGLGTSDVEPGLYVCGWVKRGPTGIIGTNLVDAEETVECLAQDWEASKLLTASDAGYGSAVAGLQGVLAARGVPVVGFDDWERIGDEEVARGQAVGKVREKLVSAGEMLAVAGAAGAQTGAT